MLNTPITQPTGATAIAPAIHENGVKAASGTGELSFAGLIAGSAPSARAMGVTGKPAPASGKELPVAAMALPQAAGEAADLTQAETGEALAEPALAPIVAPVGMLPAELLTKVQAPAVPSGDTAEPEFAPTHPEQPAAVRIPLNASPAVGPEPAAAAAPAIAPAHGGSTDTSAQARAQAPAPAPASGLPSVPTPGPAVPELAVRLSVQNPAQAPAPAPAPGQPAAPTLVQTAATPVATAPLQPHVVAAAVSTIVSTPDRDGPQSALRRVASGEPAAIAAKPLDPASASAPAVPGAPLPAPLAPASIEPVLGVLQPVSAQPSPAGEAAAPRPQQPHDFSALIDRLAQARESAQPGNVRVSLAHSDFGSVNLHFQQTAGSLAVAMSSADPEFAAAARMAMAERSFVPAEGSRSDPHGSRQEQGSGQNAASQSGNQGQAQSQANSMARQGASGPASTAAENTPTPGFELLESGARASGRGLYI